MRKRPKYRKEFASLEPETSPLSESLFFWATLAVVLGGILVIYTLLT